MALNATLPLKGTAANVLKITRVQFIYTGPAQNVFVCFGLKRDTGMFGSTAFDNGNLLEGGPTAFGYATVSVPQGSGVPIDQFVATTWPLQLGSMPTGRTFDAVVWITHQTPTAEEKYIIKLADSGDQLTDRDGKVLSLGEVTDTTPPTPAPTSPATGSIAITIVGYGSSTSIFAGGWQPEGQVGYTPNLESWQAKTKVATWSNKPLRGQLVVWTRDLVYMETGYELDSAKQHGPWFVDWTQQSGSIVDIRNGSIS
ncbi:MAG: hypothetical protein Q8R28_23245 [Dehalococcoidia bacterium]|nr:hypothetical protein [Dehalococcoidia bacterium]